LGEVNVNFENDNSYPLQTNYIHNYNKTKRIIEIKSTSLTDAYFFDSTRPSASYNYTLTVGSVKNTSPSHYSPKQVLN